MSRRANSGRRPVRPAEAASALSALHADIAERMRRMNERYHIMYVGPLMLRLDWLEMPWYERAYLRLRGRKPDIDEWRAEAMQQWDAKNTRKRCEATRPDGGEQCAGPEGHDGPHKAERAAKLEGASPVVEWTDSEENHAEIQKEAG